MLQNSGSGNDGCCDSGCGGAVASGPRGCAGSSPSATRSFDKATVEPGEDVQVTINVSNYGQGRRSQRDCCPPGSPMSLNPAVSGPQDIRVDGQRPGTSGSSCRGLLPLRTPLPRPSTTGPGRFSGTLRDCERNDYDVGGASSSNGRGYPRTDAQCHQVLR